MKKVVIYLTGILIALRITGFIDWSINWILAPIWIPCVLGIIFFGGRLVYLKIRDIYEERRSAR